MKFEQKEALEKITKWNKIAKKILKEKLPSACLGDPVGVFYPEVKGQSAGGNLQATKESQQAYLALFNKGIQHSDLQKNASNLLILGTEYGEAYEGSIFPLDISGVELLANFDEYDTGPIKLEKLEEIDVKPKGIEDQ